MASQSFRVICFDFPKCYVENFSESHLSNSVIKKMSKAASEYHAQKNSLVPNLFFCGIGNLSSSSDKFKIDFSD